jgi:hypothetical protein
VGIRLLAFWFLADTRTLMCLRIALGFASLVLSVFLLSKRPAETVLT